MYIMYYDRSFAVDAKFRFLALMQLCDVVFMARIAHNEAAFVFVFIDFV